MPDESDVDRVKTVLGNADRLELLAAGSPVPEAAEGFARYAQLLREAAGSSQPARYAFKLEFPDGRWDVAEQELTNEPRVGDLVWFEGAPWQILGHQTVARRPSATEPHRFLACAPAVAA